MSEVKSQYDKEGSPIFSVSSFLDYINEIFKIREYELQGEISELTVHPTGVYCVLKDELEPAIINCYISTWRYKSINRPLEVGMKVRVMGSPSVYKSKGRLSFVIENYEYFGEGTLKKAYEALKRKLEFEGIFKRKRILPEQIYKIGVVTSRTGAVINDFRNNLERRGYCINLYDTKVEGRDADKGVSSGIQFFNRKINQVDVIVVMRGGGSLEDLQAFNSEHLTREVFASSAPVICAIGHDKDIPLTCLAADAAPSTPTAAAVLINNTWENALNNYEGLRLSFNNQIARVCRETEKRILEASKKLAQKVLVIRSRQKELQERLRLRLLDLRQYVKTTIKNIEQKSTSLVHKIQIVEKKLSDYINSNANKLKMYHPREVLKLGFSITYLLNGGIIRSIENVKIDDRIKLQIFDGIIESKVEKITKQVNTYE